MMSVHERGLKSSCMLICAFLFLLTGCSGVQTDLTSVNDATTEYVEERATGDVIFGAIKENIHTAFLDFQLLSVSTEDYYTIEDEVYGIEDGYQFLICQLSMTNTTSQDIEMYVDDFLICWEDDKVDYGYGYTDIKEDGYMEDSFVLHCGDTVERKLMFQVPAADSYTLIYDEFYADGFQGNQYQVTFDVE